MAKADRRTRPLAGPTQFWQRIREEVRTNKGMGVGPKQASAPRVSAAKLKTAQAAQATTRAENLKARALALLARPRPPKPRKPRKPKPAGSRRYTATPWGGVATGGSRAVVKDRGVCLRLGNQNSAFSPKGRYQVCLTENQQRTLFGALDAHEASRKLGCGVFACAYAKPKSRAKVIKFTRDASDVAALIQAQPSGAVPKLYRAFKLKQGGAWEQDGKAIPAVYAVEVERLTPLAKHLQREHWGGYLPTAKDQHDHCKSELAMKPQAFKNNAYLRASCGVADAVIALDDVGLSNLTDLHGNNVGYDAKGKLKVLDLGLSAADFTRNKEPAELASATRRMLTGAIAKLRGKARTI